jgi:hypothetical protein
MMIDHKGIIETFNSLKVKEKVKFHTRLFSSMSLLVEALSYTGEKVSGEDLKYLIDKAFEDAKK